MAHILVGYLSMIGSKKHIAQINYAEILHAFMPL